MKAAYDARAYHSSGEKVEKHSEMLEVIAQIEN
jgi:hypothetical protein